MDYNIRYDPESWARCGRCGHKLFKVVTHGNTQLAIKCHSCKAMNFTLPNTEKCINCQFYSNDTCLNEQSNLFLKQIDKKQACELFQRKEKI